MLLKKVFGSVLAMLMALVFICSGSLALAADSTNSADNSSKNEFGLLEQFPYYETAFHNYSAPAIAQETLSYINHTKPFWPSVEQMLFGVEMKTTKTDTQANNLINFINSRQNKITYVKATFSSQAEYEQCIKQSLEHFDAPVIIRQYEADNGTNGEYMAITRQYCDNGTLSYYLNDPNWKYNANWTQNSKVNPEQGWTLTSAESYKAIMNTSGHELYICQLPQA